jgi:hypothetical protein
LKEIQDIQKIFDCGFVEKIKNTDETGYNSNGSLLLGDKIYSNHKIS